MLAWNAMSRPGCVNGVDRQPTGDLDYLPVFRQVQGAVPVVRLSWKRTWWMSTTGIKLMIPRQSVDRNLSHDDGKGRPARVRFTSESKVCPIQ